MFEFFLFFFCFFSQLSPRGNVAPAVNSDDDTIQCKCAGVTRQVLGGAQGEGARVLCDRAGQVRSCWAWPGQAGPGRVEPDQAG